MSFGTAAMQCNNLIALVC